MKTNSVNNPNNSQPINIPLRNGVRGRKLGHFQRPEKEQQQDTFERTQNVEKYSNYNSSGATNKPVSAQATATQTTTTQQTAVSGASSTQPTATQAAAAENNTPDITAFHFWEDPRRQEVRNTMVEVFTNRAQESLRTSDPGRHVWQRYFDPTARHFVGHDLDSLERRQAWEAELRAMDFIQSGRTGYIGIEYDFVNPIFEGRGLGSGDPNVPRIGPLFTDRESATWMFQIRNNITQQIRDLFSSNGVLIPENTRLRFIIDLDYNLRVEGTDDEDLIRQIEELLNRNDNSRQLFMHIASTRTFNPTQSRDDSYWAWQVGVAIRDYTGLSLWNDLEFADGRFLTEDGTNILDILAEKDMNPHVMAWIIDELASIAARGGLGESPDFSLSIDFENGNLFCVGQENGFGPGQTGWIDNLPGTDAPGARDYA
ncbi:MAG: DUF4885 domain-containing protein [Oscillospiraceae bacterium]|nr:DUF4885 domain-containing protein [Oscillospiraceae bacterium]MCL2279630.1 DUF4885 domain-containing protein [Oscillospiraceae bacterium]